jgi:hypothetical protein
MYEHELVKIVDSDQSHRSNLYKEYTAKYIAEVDHMPCWKTLALSIGHTSWCRDYPLLFW